MRKSNDREIDCFDCLLDFFLDPIQDSAVMAFGISHLNLHLKMEIWVGNTEVSSWYLCILSIDNLSQNNLPLGHLAKSALMS